MPSLTALQCKLSIKIFIDNTSCFRNEELHLLKLFIESFDQSSSMFVGLQPTVIASRASHLLLERSVMTTKIQRIVDAHRPLTSMLEVFITDVAWTGANPLLS